ncbi:MAG TPA: hypothetical protein VGK25_02755, partial [Ignavibacteria bacterium]
MPNTKNKISVTSFWFIVLLLVSFMGCKNENGIAPASNIDKNNTDNVSVAFYSGSTGSDNTLI